MVDITAQICFLNSNFLRKIGQTCLNLDIVGNIINPPADASLSNGNDPTYRIYRLVIVLNKRLDECKNDTTFNIKRELIKPHLLVDFRKNYHVFIE